MSNSRNQVSCGKDYKIIRKSGRYSGIISTDWLTDCLQSLLWLVVLFRSSAMKWKLKIKAHLSRTGSSTSDASGDTVVWRAQDIERPWTFNAPSRSSATSRSRSISKLDLHIVFYYYYSDHQRPDAHLYGYVIKWSRRLELEKTNLLRLLLLFLFNTLAHFHRFLAFSCSFSSPFPSHINLPHHFHLFLSISWTTSAVRRQSVWFDSLLLQKMAFIVYS